MLKYCRYGIGFLIGTNIYISLISTALALTCFIIFNKRDLFMPGMFVFFATQTAYNLQRFFKWRRNIIHPFLIPYVPKKLSSWLILIGTGITGLLFATYFISFKQLILLAAVVCITGTYVFVDPFSKKLTGLRYIPFLKTFLVSASWTTLFFVLTFPNEPLHMLSITWFYWLILFLEILIACILFDLRDIETDRGEVRTFANTFDLNGVFFLWLFISALILTLLITKVNYTQLILPFLGVAMIQLYCIFKKPGALIFTFLVDGSLILLALLNYFAFTNA